MIHPSDTPEGFQDHDCDEFDLAIKEAVLAEALDAFSKKVLGNDLLYSAIQNTIVNNSVPDAGFLMGFKVTPNIIDGNYRLCLEESAKHHVGQVESEQGHLGSIFFSLVTMKYITVCELGEVDETGKPTLFVDKPFLDISLGRNVAVDKPTQEEHSAVDQAVRAMLGGINEIVTYCSLRGTKIVTDEYGALQIAESLEQRSYSID